MSLFTTLLSKFKREPDFIIGEKHDPYMLRWYIIPRNKFLNIYLHKFLRSDHPVYHDHPWWSFGILLKGSYYEHTPYSGGDLRQVFKRGSMKLRGPKYFHWVEVKEGPIWTIFITGPWRKPWGFLCPKGWYHYSDVLVNDTREGNDGVRCPD